MLMRSVIGYLEKIGFETGNHSPVLQETCLELLYLNISGMSLVANHNYAN
jgi:hypothetical protein